MTSINYLPCQKWKSSPRESPLPLAVDSTRFQLKPKRIIHSNSRRTNKHLRHSPMQYKCRAERLTGDLDENSEAPAEKLAAPWIPSPAQPGQVMRGRQQQQQPSARAVRRRRKGGRASAPRHRGERSQSCQSLFSSRGARAPRISTLEALLLGPHR